MISPVTNYVFGPSRSTDQAETYQKLKTYPMFGPLTTCFFSRTHAPFTIVLNEVDRVGLNYAESIGEITRIFLGSSYTGPQSDEEVGRRKRALQDGKA